jgi:hydrogenase maturation protease
MTGHAKDHDPERPGVLVIGVGNPDRGDDAAGLEVAARVRAAVPAGIEVRELTGEPLALIDMWARSRAVFLIDAVRSGGRPGDIYRFDAVAAPLDARFSHRGTHALGIADVIELARALECLPARLVGYGIEGGSFAAGSGLSPEAAAATRAVSARLLAELAPHEPAPHELALDRHGKGDS